MPSSRLALTTTLLAAGIAFAAHAAQDAPVPTQRATSDCSKQAAGKTGDERRRFIDDCLRQQPPGMPSMDRQDKLKTCSADADTKGLTGDVRETFLDSCLKK